jgi:hypothetical protein
MTEQARTGTRESEPPGRARIEARVFIGKWMHERGIGGSVGHPAVTIATSDSYRLCGAPSGFEWIPGRFAVLHPSG